MNEGHKFCGFRNDLTPNFSSSAESELGTLAPHNFVTLANEEYVWIGMIPGITGMLIPRKNLVMTGARDLPLTFCPNLPVPRKKMIYVIEELGDNEISTSIHFDLESVNLNIFIY